MVTMQTCTLFVALCCCLALSFATPLTASAQDDISDGMDVSDSNSAMGFYKKGIAFTKLKNYRQAAEMFVKAWGIDKEPSLAYNAGRAYENAGERENARLYYSIALESKPTEEVKERKICAQLKNAYRN